VPRPAPTAAQLLAQALLERSTVPEEIARGTRAVLRAPRRIARDVMERLSELGAFAWAGLEPAPRTPYNVPIGPHRRYEWADADLDTFKAIKDRFGATINDVVLTVVAGALGRHLRAQGHRTAGLELRALVPVSVRSADTEQPTGNHVAAVWAPLPVGETDPAAALQRVHTAMDHVKATHEAVGAQVLTELADFAPPTLMSQAARLQARQRLFNVVVTNVPGPQFPLYLLGRRLTAIYPVVPLAANQAIGIAVMSYDGRLGFGLLADHDALPDLSALADMLRESIDGLATAAGVRRAPRRRRARPADARTSKAPATP
jgi:WS/DGAT/MGAT family acyltransferase